MKMRKEKPFVISGLAAATTAISAATAAAGIGSALSIVGTVGSLASAGLSLAQGQAASKASRRAENLRKEQMQAEARQKQLAALRRRIIAGGQVTANAENSGASIEGSSIGGAFGGINASFATDTSNIRTAEITGASMFDANAAYSQAKGSADLFSGVGSLFKDAGQAAGPLIKTGMSLFNDE